MQPINRLATSTVKMITEATGWRPRWLLDRLLRIGPVRLRLENGRTMTLCASGDDWLTNQFYWYGWKAYEAESTTLFFRLATRASVTLDIGAYIGIYTLLAAFANPQGTVYAFEPMPEVYARLVRNVSKNHLDNVHCIETAVGDTNGTATLYHFKEDFLSGLSTLSAQTQPVGHRVYTREVPVLTIDEFVRQRELPRVDLVKIDTEVTEPQVLRGMLDTLHRYRPKIVCEVLADCFTDHSLEALLRPLGYRYYLLTADGIIPRDRIQGHLDWRNYLFLPPETVG